MYNNNINLLIEKGFYYLAALEIAEMLYLHRSSNKLHEDPFKTEYWELIRKEATAQLEKGIDILSYGKIWDEDEILLVFTIMINLHLLIFLFKQYKQPNNINISVLTNHLENVDINQPKNRKSFLLAIKMLNKNCSIQDWQTMIGFKKPE